MFENIVRLYRAAGRPQLEGDYFSFDGNSTQEILELVEALQNLPQHQGSLDLFHRDAARISFEFLLPANEFGRFHSSVRSFVQTTPALANGKLPTNFYILELDYASFDEQVPPSIARLHDLCELISLLGDLSADAASAAAQVNSRMTFIVSATANSPAKTVVLNTRFGSELLDHPIAHLDLLRALLKPTTQRNVHIEERKSILRLAVADTLSDSDAPSIALLVKHWKETLIKYRHNLLSFLNQYNFEKTRKDITTAQIDFATKLNSVLGDIAGKLLALPISFAGLLLLRNAKDTVEQAIYASGMAIITITMLAILINQFLQIGRIISSFNLVFDQYNRGLPEKLITPVNEARASIKRQKIVLNTTFVIFSILAIVPTVASIWLINQGGEVIPAKHTAVKETISNEDLITSKKGDGDAPIAGKTGSQRSTSKAQAQTPAH
jgi:hypothetical protein